MHQLLRSFNYWKYFLSCRDLMNLILEKGHSRVPVYYEECTNIIGLILVYCLPMFLCSSIEEFSVFIFNFYLMIMYYVEWLCTQMSGITVDDKCLSTTEWYVHGKGSDFSDFSSPPSPGPKTQNIHGWGSFARMFE